MQEILRWDSCGTGHAETYICSDFLDFEDNGTGAVGALDGFEVKDLIRLKNQALLEGQQPYRPIEPIWPTREYYVYYNCHPSSGYKTKLMDSESHDEVEIKIIPPKGYTLCAMWSEVIIFRK